MAGAERRIACDLDGTLAAVSRRCLLLLSAVPEPIPLRENTGSAPAVARARTHLTLHRLAMLSAPGNAPVRLERKQAALLAYVHLAGNTARGRIAGLLWPGATASGARANLRQCLARLRRIAPDLIAEAADTLALGLAVQVDEPVDIAAELLDGYDYADCDDFARWLAARVDEQRASRQAALNTALRAATGRGDFTEAQALADALLALDRESEDPYRALMEVAYLRGDFAAAVRAWDRCREMLRQLYGVAPSSATQVLGASILAAAPPTVRAIAAPAVIVGQPLPPAEAGNLGPAPPVLHGRADEIAAVRATLQAHRLVTLLGIGGVGKTSLALAVAHAERESRPTGAWFVDMAPVIAPEHVATAMAHALGLNIAAHRDPVDELVRTLATADMLVVIDNAEHLWEAISGLVSELLGGTTHLRLLVTSRQALRLPQEQRFPLAGLSAPLVPDLSDLRQLGALTLFEARVTALIPNFRLSTDNAHAVAEVCRRLDGVPLAIELAAARVPVLGLDELRNRLHQSLRVLGSRATISAPRHQTLRATFDWTHELLSPREQVLLRRLAVFVGGFSLSLAEDVTCGDLGRPEVAATTRERDDSGLLDDLGALIEKSLVVVAEAVPPRYRLLEVTRAYALEKLADAGEFERISQRHAHAIWRLFAGAEADLNEKVRGALSRGQFLHRLAPELDNLRAARAWSQDSPHHGVLSLGLATASTEALRLLGRATEALQTLLALRGLVDDERLPAETVELFWTGLCALGTHGRMPRDEMLEVIARAERIYRRIGSARRIHVGLYRKGFALMHLGDASDAQRAVTEMQSLEAPEWPSRAIVQRLNLQGAVDAVLGRFDVSVSAFRSAEALLATEPDESDVVLNVLSNLCMSLIGSERYEEAVSVAADVALRGASPVVRNIALRASMVAMTFLGRLGEAREITRQAMPGWITDDMLPHMLSVFAWLAYLEGRIDDAIRLDGAARKQVARMGLANSPVFDRARTNLERAVSTAGLSSADIERWRAQGERLDEDEVVALCTGEARVRAPSRA